MHPLVIVAVCICKFSNHYFNALYNYIILSVAEVIAIPGKISLDGFEHAGSISSYGSGGYGSKGFSSGSGLKTIAQGSAQQANSAVLNQHTAARQAAFTAKSSLAQAAVGVSFSNYKFWIYLLNEISFRLPPLPKLPTSVNKF